LLPLAAENLFSHISLLNARDLRLAAAESVAVGREVDLFAAAALALPYLNRIVLRAPTADDLAQLHPARAAFASVGGAAAFVCVGEACSLPVTDPTKIAEVVTAMRAPS
jgi:uncharacterized protein YyaL (SSP411 family)